MSVITPSPPVRVRKLSGHVRTVSEITAADRGHMFQLMEEHYAHVEYARFASDLAEKQWILEVRDESGELRGFSTQMLLEAIVEGRPVRALFSGDTIVHREDWGQSALTQQWGRFALQLMRRYADRPLYWFLISKGYKTYRFLPVFFREFYPRYDRATPTQVSGVLATFARQKFGEQYDEAQGIIAADTEGCRLRPGVAALTAERLQDPHVAYFQERNPRHESGDELCCLAPLTPENFTAAAYRVIGERP